MTQHRPPAAVRVLVTCPHCGDQRVPHTSIRLVVCSVRPWSTYAFTCPACRRQLERPATTNVIRQLLTTGVTAERWHVPAEVLERPPGPPFDLDDLLELVSQLRLHDDLAALAHAP